MTKDISDEEFDKMLDEHFSNDRSIRIGKTSIGRKNTQIQNDKISKSKLGKAFSDAHLESIRASSKLRRGIKLSEETRAKVSAAGKGRKVSEETRAKIGKANKGRKLPPVSEETRINRIEGQKASYANGRIGGMTGKRLSEEHRAKISEGNKGKILSDEICNKISQSKKGKSFGGNLQSIITPFGTFSSIKEAGQFEEEQTGKKFNPNRFTKLLKDLNSGYKKI